MYLDQVLEHAHFIDKHQHLTFLLPTLPDLPTSHAACLGAGVEEQDSAALVA
jgi:hypothetical protein